MNQVDLFMEKLRSGLANMPKATADDAIQYYTEYFADAQQAGLSEEDMLKKTGTADQVIQSIRDDLAITATQERPNALRLYRTSRQMLGKRAARTAVGTSLAIVSIAPLLGAIVLYLAAFALFVAALAVTATLVFSMVTQQGFTTADTLGQAGLAAALFSLLMLLALGLRLGANALARVTMQLFRKIANRAKPTGVQTAPLPKKRSRAARVLAVLLTVLLTVGIIFSIVAGLPQQYYRLWNSERPSGIEPIALDITGGSQATSKLAIEGLNANITVLPAVDGKIRVTYEKAPHLQLDWRMNGGTLQLSESANGRLPFFSLLAAHQGTVGLNVYLPGDTKDLMLDIVSKSGDVVVKIPFGGGRIYTANNITVKSNQEREKAELRSWNGVIMILEP